MGQFDNVLRGNLFIWFMITLVFTIFIIIKLIKNQVDIKDDVGQQKYREGQARKQAPTESLQRFDVSVVNADRPSEDDTIIQRWLKKVHEFEVYYMPILFPFALNVMTGTTYSFLIIIFFVSLMCLLLFNVWKLHRQCVQHPVLRILLQSLGYIISFFLLLNVWPTGTHAMPYSIRRA